MQVKEYFQRPQKKYKKIVYEEGNDSESETGEGQHVPEENNLKTKEKIKYLII